MVEKAKVSRAITRLWRYGLAAYRFLRRASHPPGFIVRVSGFAFAPRMPLPAVTRDMRRGAPGMPASMAAISVRRIFFLSAGGAIIILGNDGHSLHYLRLGEFGATARHAG